MYCLITEGIVYNPQEQTSLAKAAHCPQIAWIPNSESQYGDPDCYQNPITFITPDPSIKFHRNPLNNFLSNVPQTNRQKDRQANVTEYTTSLLCSSDKQTERQTSKPYWIHNLLAKEVIIQCNDHYILTSHKYACLSLLGQSIQTQVLSCVGHV